MTTSEIRKRFLDFFEKNGHAVVPSDLLVPRNDPTLLFTGAGMNQFKDQFMGKNITFTRAVSCQKCLRTGDLENVGKTPRHHTFFEMLGNFSFGDYFKKEAIQWGWEFMTKEMGLPEEKLWVSIYEDDDEAYSIWLDDIKVPAERIVKLGAHDNFWPADAPTKGPNGPCGPSSEIFYDWGEGTGCGKKECDPACDCGRFVEVWNLVFTQFERRSDGSLQPLPSKNIDTGMGLERMASVMQGAKTNFDTDLFRPIITSIMDNLVRLREDKIFTINESIFVIADHIRAVTFAICDGVSPSNEKQGYVIRKLIRRAYLKGGLKGAFLYKVVPAIAGCMKDAYPELMEKREHIAAIIKEEEERFQNALDSALPILKDMLAKRPEKLSGEQLFKLVDTFGLPIDVIEEEVNIALDIEGFEKLMEERKEQSRKGSEITSEFIFQPDLFKGAPKPEFSEKLPLEATIEFILKDGKGSDRINEGDRAEVITSPQSSRFYAEAGGQVGDTGRIEKEGGEMKVLNTFETGGRKVLEVFVKKDTFSVNDRVNLYLDADKKQNTALNHTATHLLQAALRKILGEHVKQSGSLVSEKRLRFDFTHMKKMSDRELRKVEDLINDWVKNGIEVCKEVKQIKEAQEEGALSFFGEKYGDTVRVVTIGDESKELCGGTHVDNTAEIGLVKIISESSVASGIRRIEAVTGENTRKWIKKTLEDLLNRRKFLCSNIKDAKEAERQCPGLAEAGQDAEKIVSGKVKIDRAVMDDFENRLKPTLLKACEEAEKAIKKGKKSREADILNEVKVRLDNIITRGEKVADVMVIDDILPGEIGMDILRKAAGYAEKKVHPAIVFLGSSKDGKAYLNCAVTSELVKRGITAREIINKVAGKIGGGGGGKDTFAQAGGDNPEGLQEAREIMKKIIEEKIK